jgi:Fic family protein
MKLSDTLNQINKLKAEAEKWLNAKEAIERKVVFWKKFRLEYNYNSNHLEGNTMSLGHTELLLIRNETAGQYHIRELEEMKAHDAALAIVRNDAADENHILTEVFIRQLNEIILVEPFYKDAQTASGQPTRKLITPGKYKHEPNSVLLSTGEMFEYAKPEETPAMMQELIEWYRNEETTKEFHPVQLAALLHYKFVRIHPFDDSNGRTSRLLMNYVLLKNGYCPAVIESVDKKNYLAALSQADTGDVEAFVNYVTEKALRWQQIYLDALEGKDISEESDIDKQIELMKKRLKGGDKLNIPRSRDAVEEVIKGSIFPLLKKVEEKYKKLDELFLDYDRKVFISYNGSGTEYSVGNKDSLLQQIESSLFTMANGNVSNTTTRLHYSYMFKGFKKTVRASSTNIAITVNFEHYNYKVTVSGKEFTRAYGEQLNKEDIQEMVQFAVDNILQTIEAFTKHK